MNEAAAGEKRTEIWENTALYSFVKGLAWVVFHTLAPVRYHDGERLKREGPVMVIANHQHALDPALLAVPVRQQVVFLAKKELGGTPLLKKIMTGLHCILVDRHNRDLRAIRECSRVLKEGHVLGIFPEGTRHHETQMEELETGSSLLALRSGVPVVPVWIPEKFRFFHVNHCWVGEDICYDDLRAQGVDTAACDALTERIRETYRDMKEHTDGLKKKI